MLEMLVVGLIGILVLTAIANASRWFGKSMSNLQSSAEITRELKLATDAIALDYGKAIATRSEDGETLQLDFDGPSPDGVAQWESPDVVIEYARQGEKLLRRDTSTGIELPVADHVSAIAAAAVYGKLQLTLTASARDIQESVTLQFDGP
jgi:hypothetical protein